MKEIKIDKCPYCESTDFAKGYQLAQESVYPQSFGFKMGSSIEHIICKECGSIIHSKVKNIKRFK